MEILITFILVFMVVSVASDSRAPADKAPKAVGFALAVAVLIAGPFTGGGGQPGVRPWADARCGRPDQRVALRTRADRRQGAGGRSSPGLAGVSGAAGVLEGINENPDVLLYPVERAL